MYPLALLPLELVLAGLVVAQSTAACSRDGLTKLNNQYGQSPCTVQKKLQQACADDKTPGRNCTCNTVMYNINAACAVCSGDDIPIWLSWAEQNTCSTSPASFSLPSDFEVDTNVIPHWAYQQLSSEHDFDLQEAIRGPEPDGGGLSRAAQIAVPIAVAVGVALLVFLGFWWKLRRQRKRYLPRPRSQSASADGASLFTDPLRWFRELKLSMSSHRLRTSRKESSWEIDDDSHLLVGRSDTPYHSRSRSQSQSQYHDPYSNSYYSPEERAHSRTSFAGTHARAGSSLSMLSNIEFPDVRVPTFVERFIKFKDGIRKSASYKAKHVSPVSPDQGFRIDGAEGEGEGDAPSPSPPPPPVPQKQKYHTVPLRKSKDASGSGSVSAPAWGEERQHWQGRAARPTPLEVVVERSDHDPQSEHGHGHGHTAIGMDEVLIISRDGGDNFTINDTATTATGSPRTPSTRQPPSAYSGTRSYTAQTQGSFSLTPSFSPSFSPSHSPGLTPSATASMTGTPTRSSWLPSPHRANTSSTVSGAYPHELRRDPDLAAPLSWANRFPDPPQTFPQAHSQIQTQTFPQTQVQTGMQMEMQTVAAVYPQATAQTQAHSARTLPIPPGPQSQTQMLSPPPKGYPESARTF